MVNGFKSAVQGARREVEDRLGQVCTLPDRDDLDDEVMQAAGEVIANAVEHSRSAGRPGSVRVELESRERGLLLAVWDQGLRAGAPAPPHTTEEQARVGALAEAASPPSLGDFAGFGIGLGVVEACSSVYGYASDARGGVTWVVWMGAPVGAVPGGSEGLVLATTID